MGYVLAYIQVTHRIAGKADCFPRISDENLAPLGQTLGFMVWAKACLWDYGW